VADRAVDTPAGPCRSCTERGPHGIWAEHTEHTGGEHTVIVLGIILLIIGFIAKITIVWTVGIIVLIIGAVLAIAGGAGHAVGGRKHWY
jgi:uncharacterized membrane protein HdeD (DUF308 family)